MQKIPLLLPFSGVCVLWLIQMGLWICYLLFSSMLSFSYFSNIVIYSSFPSFVSLLPFFSLYCIFCSFLPLIPTPYLFPDIWEVFWIPRHIFLCYYISNFSWSSMACTSVKFFPLVYSRLLFYLFISLLLFIFGVFSLFIETSGLFLSFNLGVHLHGLRFCFIYLWYLMLKWWKFSRENSWGTFSNFMAFTSICFLGYPPTLYELKVRWFCLGQFQFCIWFLCESFSFVREY